MFNYEEVGSDCDSVIDNVWKLSNYIQEQRAITISYYKMNRDRVKHRIIPVSIMFSEYYFYLIAYKCEDTLSDTPTYFRIDRICDMTVHREKLELPKMLNLMKDCSANEASSCGRTTQKNQI